MDAHVSDRAVAVLHVIAPAAGMDIGAERAHGGGAGPHFVIESFRWRLVWWVADAAPSVAISLDEANPAQASFLDQLAGLEQVGGTAALCAHLHDTTVLTRGRDHGLTFEDVHTNGFLDIDI